LIGASTGGPGQIQKIIRSIKKDFDATIVIAQHMQSGYLQSFTKQLNNNCAIKVELSNDKQIIQERKIYILLDSCEIVERNNEIIFCKSNEVLNYSPNVNLLFNSATKINKSIKIMCIVLTGIGDDGAIGAFNLAKNGAVCINESEDSSIVYGMPKAVHELNPKASQLSIDEICEEIGKF